MEAPIRLLRLSLLYAFHAEPTTDTEALAKQLQRSQSLKAEVMSAAEKLIAKGEVDGRAEGTAQGIAIGMLKGEALGRIQMLRKIVDLPEFSFSEIATMSHDDVEASFGELEADYNRQFKRL